MADIAGWIAPVATMIAAMMTAANLGARITGWGFVVFTVGSIAWVVVGATSGQTNLVVANGLLLAVNLAGIWRWLGLRVRSGDAAEAEGRRSRREARPDLISAIDLVDRKVTGPGGAVIARVAEVMVQAGSGRIDHLIVRVGGFGGVGEMLRRLDWASVGVVDDGLRVDLDGPAMARLPLAERG